MLRGRNVAMIGLILTGQLLWPQEVSPVAGPHRVALVIGNNAYPAAPLKNAVNDAVAVAAALNRHGFLVQRYTDVTLDALERAINQFLSTVKIGDVALVYYSGHGMQIDGDNYIIPTSFAPKDEIDAKHTSYSVDRLMERLAERDPRLNVLILDACRDNPFHPTRSQIKGWAPVNTGWGTFVAFATAPGSTASDNPGGVNGLFTSKLIGALEQPGWSLDAIFSWVRKQVFLESKGQQLPWTSSSVIGDFYFIPPAATSSTQTRESSFDENSPYAGGIRHIKAGKYAEALDLFETASRLGNTSERGFRNARTDHSLDPVRAALAAYTGEIQTNPRSVRAFRSRGDAQLELGEIDKAIADYTVAIGLDPGVHDNYRKRALAYVIANRGSLAIADLKNLSNVPSTWEDYYIRSLALIQENHVREALSDAAIATGLASPRNGTPYGAKANAEYALGQYQPALADAAICIERSPDSATCYEIRGNVYRALGNVLEAAEMFRLATEKKRMATERKFRL
jgi:tetratricopeptide (TPR) repeat protein